VTILVIGLAIFLGIHSISIATPELRAGAVAAMGTKRWQGVYSLVSAVGFGLILYGFHLARQAPVVIYEPPAWTRQVALVLMLPVFPLVLAAYFPGRIKNALKHPMLAATMLWSVAHLLANGMLADVILFGLFLVWAILDRLSFERRPPQVIRAAPQGRFNDLIAIIVGLAIYVLFILWAHLWLFGVSLKQFLPQ
jgi:uncharacterized membrane protein